MISRVHSSIKILHVHLKIGSLGTSLAVQWLGLRVSTVGGAGSIHGWGTKIPHAMWRGQRKKKRKRVIFLKRFLKAIRFNVGSTKCTWLNWMTAMTKFTHANDNCKSTTITVTWHWSKNMSHVEKITHFLSLMKHIISSKVSSVPGIFQPVYTCWSCSRYIFQRQCFPSRMHCPI